MNGKFKLSDDILEDVVGGVEIQRGSILGNTKKISSRMDIFCPKCGKIVHQVFYTDGSVEYKDCPNRTENGQICHNPLGVG